MQIVNAPVALPGCCFICGAASREYFIDTGRSIEFHGAVYFCSECLTEMATAAGFLSVKNTALLKFEMEKLEARVFELTKKEAGLEQTVRGLVAAGYSNDNGIDSLNNSDLVIKKSENGTSGAEDYVGKGTGEVIKPPEHENVGELRPNDGGNESFELEFS